MLAAWGVIVTQPADPSVISKAIAAFLMELSLQYAQRDAHPRPLIDSTAAVGCSAGLGGPLLKKLEYVSNGGETLK